MRNFEKLKDEIKQRRAEREATRLLEFFKQVNQEEMKKLGLDMMQFGRSYYSVEEGMIKRLDPFDAETINNESLQIKNNL